MKKSVLFMLLVLTFTFLSAANGIISADLQNQLNTISDSEQIRVNIIMKDSYDTANLQNSTRNLRKAEKREFVVNELKSFSNNSQSSLLDFLNSERAGVVTSINPLWLVNVVTIEADKATINTLAKRADIKSIDHDEMRKMIVDPIIDENADNSPNREITWNVTQVNSDDVWAQGYYGAGVTVAVLDTGVNYNHQDLNDHLWTSPDYPNHGYDFANADDNPMDDHGHGTHCAGTVAGDGTAGSQTGMAPEATIMALKILTADGGGSESFTWDGIQFAIDNGADVLSMSIGWLHAWNPTRETWREAMGNCLAAGVVAAIAAGNEGAQQGAYPIPDNVRTPGDCPPPWLNPDQTLIGGTTATITVGATNSSDGIAGFSGRGPVDWSSVTGYNDYPHQPELGLIRPDISAPGDGIKSLAHYSNTGYEAGWSGTSMATPGVAGVIALMLSKNYELTPAEIDQIIEENAAIPQTPKNNTFGSGRIDALESINTITAPETPPLIAKNPNPADEAENVVVSASLVWANGGGATNYNVYFGTDNPPSNIIDGINTTSTSVDISELEYNSTYYWKVDSFNDFGNIEGEIWSFTTISPADEDFETGDFSSYAWGFAGNSDWSVQASDAFSGTYRARSGIIGNNSTSELNLTMTSTLPGTISFARKTSCENVSGSTGDYYDYLQFLIDGVEQDKWAGETPWAIASYDVTAGEHTFTWNFYKDGAVTGGDDAVYLDFITFPYAGEVDPGLITGTLSLENGGDPSLALLEIGNETVYPNDDGSFAQSLLPGTYQLTATMPGYSTLQQNNIVVSANETTDLALNMLFLFPASNLVAEQTATPVELNWDAPVTELSVDGYRIFRNLDNGEFTEITEVTETTYADTPTEEGNYGYYVIVRYESNEESAASETVYLDFTDGSPSDVPTANSLVGNYPNPFNPVTQIKFAIKERGNVKLEIYDIRGRKVKDLVNGTLDAGSHSETWRGDNNLGNSVGSGIYFYKLRAGRYTSTKKMLLMK